MSADTLTYYPDSEPGITRKRCGRGFSYFDPHGSLIRAAAERRRLAGLAVPPAYQDVWLCPVPNGHLQATGRDTKGRKQYLYNPQWIEAQAQVKFDALADFGASLPRIRRRVQQDLQADAGEREFALAAAVTLIDRAALRVGNPQYLAENGSHGALTLRNRHLRLTGNEISLRYAAKGGQRVRRRMTDAKLARVLGKINDLPGATLLTWLDEEGTAQTLRSDALNTYIAQAAGVEGATAKTFRTWAGTCAAFEVAQKGHATIKEMAAAAASRLHNTPTIARKSYIHPDVVALAGKPPVEVVANALRGLKAAEQRVLGFLETNG